MVPSLAWRATYLPACRRVIEKILRITRSVNQEIRIIFNFAKEVGSPSAVDRTDYGTASGSARGFAQHHSQQLSRAAVCGDAQNINNAARNMRVAHSFMTGLNAPPPCARAF